MDMKLFDSELKLMELLWERTEPLAAKDVSLIAADRIGWNKNTTYTILKKLVDKGALRREEPGFRCIPLVTREDVRRRETRSLIDRLFGGSRRALLSALLEDEEVTQSEIDELRQLIDGKEQP